MSGEITPSQGFLVPGGSGPKTRAAKPFPAQWPSPNIFVARHPQPVADDFREFLDIQLLELLVFCIYADTTFLREFIFHLQEDEKLRKAKIKADEAINWLEEVSTLLRGAKETALSYEIRRHGSPFFMEKDEVGNEKAAILNLPFHAELFSITRRVSYDADTKQCYLYETSSGLWRLIFEKQITKEVAFYFKEFSDGFEGSIRGKLLTGRTNYFLNEFRKMVSSFTYFGDKPKVRFVHANNTMVPLESKEPHHFSPLFFSKNRINTDYDKNAYPSRFIEQFLKCSLNDEDIDLLQMWAGSVLLGENLYHNLLLITGEGDTGKSAFVKIIEKIIGTENCAELRVKKLDDRFEIGRFLDKTLLIGLDVSSDFLNNDCSYKLKGLTGGEPYVGELKYSNEQLKIIGKFNIVVTCNSKFTLQLQDDAGAWRRRIWLVKFQKLKPFKKNPELVDTLLREEGPGILNWMIKGAKMILHLKNSKAPGVPLTAAQKARVDSLLDASDSLAVFIKERIVSSPKENLSTAEIFGEYEEFCVEKDWPPLGEREAQHAIRSEMKKIHNENRRYDIKRDGKNVRGYAHVKFV
jgi:putative DNA primase/helicase